MTATQRQAAPGSGGRGTAIPRITPEGPTLRRGARCAAPAAAASDFRAETGRTAGARGDTTSDEQARAAAADAAGQLGGPIDTRVNAAAEPGGHGAPPKLGEISGELSRRDGHQGDGLRALAREAAEGMRARGGAARHHQRPAARQSGNAAACATSRSPR
jgi:hypothetical protein